MRTRFLMSVFSLGLLATALIPAAWCQNAPNAERLGAIRANLEQIKNAYDQLPPNHRTLLDGATHVVQLARVFDKFLAKAAAGKPVSRKEINQAVAKIEAESEPGAGVVSVNDRSTDLDFSGFDGVTQSETSTAMCGNQVVVGFNDSGSEFQTFFFGTGGVSFSGGAVSSDRGNTFHDIGAINPGPDFNNFVIGDPIITCSDPSTFYYTQLFSLGSFSSPLTAIAISKSVDGGNTWGDPIAAVTKTAANLLGIGHFLDKPWNAIDPSNPSKMYVSYTDFDNSQTSPACGKQARTAIELVVSNDGGQTFGNPVIVDEQCGNDTGVQASHVAVNSHGLVYIAWERFTPTTIEVRITHLAANGAPTPSTLIDQKVFGGDTLLVFHLPGTEFETDLQGQFRDLVGLDLAIDRSGGPSDGSVYVTWDDARNKSVPDLLGFTIQGLGIPPDQFPGQVFLPFTPLILTAGNYAYTDVLVSRSRDGVHFGPSVQVNSDPQPKFGGGHDHFQPAIATDSTGRVAICWYDRRNDPQNFQIERFCGESRNGGNDWGNFRVPITPFSPIHRQDFLINPAYMGDYDGLASDFTGKSKGFIGAFEWMSSGMNPDVKAYRFE